MDMEALIKAGREVGELRQVDGGGAYVVVPDGCHLTDAEEFLPTPPRIKVSVKAETVAAFCAYLKRFASPDTITFAQQQSFRLEAVVDYHAVGQPSHCGHRLIYNAPRAEEWEIWRGSSGKKMSQQTFAEFVEDNLPDIRKPAGAELLEIAQRLEATKKVEYVSAERLSDGQREFTYAEIVEGASRKGKLKVPEQFTLGIPVFFQGELYEVTARLRYRIDNEKKLVLWYDLHRASEIEQQAFAEIVDEVRKMSEPEVLLGSV